MTAKEKLIKEINEKSIYPPSVKKNALYMDVLEVAELINKHWDAEQCSKHNRRADVLTCPDCYNEGVNLPTDKQVEKWFVDNIDNDSASSAIYKFRLWLVSSVYLLPDKSELDQLLKEIKEQLSMNEDVLYAAIPIIERCFAKFLENK